jgi:predicted Zn-dependent protease
MFKRKSQEKILYGIVILSISFFLFGSFAKGAYAMTTEEEKKLGKQVLLEMEKKVEFVRDLNLQTFLNKIGQSLVAQIGPVPFKFKFYLIKALEPNAFALPGGYIFITTGAIVMAESEQEVAGVLGHEIAHVTARHVAQMIERSKRLNIASMVAILAAMLAGRGGVGSQAAATMATAAAGALELKYTREMEVDADQNGFHYLIKAGYDPYGLITFLNKIYKTSLVSSPNIPPYLSTHPAIENRISLLENLLQMGPRSKGPFKTLGNFERIQVKTFTEEREPQVAVTQFQSLIDFDPYDFNGYYGLSLAYRKMGRLDKSIEALQQAHSLAPKDLDISRELGIAYFLVGKVDQAIENLEGVRPDPEGGGNSDLLALYYLGRGYQEKEDFAKALPLFLKVRKEEPEYIDIYHHLGSIYGRMGQKGLSHFYFGRYFKLKGEGNNALLHFRKAFDWLETGSPEKEEAQREIKELTSPQR